MGFTHSIQHRTKFFKSQSIIISMAIFTTGLILIFISNSINESNKLIEILNQLGFVLVPSGLISFIFEYSLRQSFLQSMRNEFTFSLRKEFESLGQLQNAGIVEIYESLSDDLIVNHFSQANDQIKILQTWIPDLVQIEKSFKYAYINNCSIQILLLDPNSDFAKERSVQMGFENSEAVITNINSNIMELRRVCKEFNIQKNFELKLYSAVPLMQIYSFDNMSFMGFYWQGKMAMHGPQLLIKGHDTYYGKEINNYFNFMWNSAKPIKCVE